jgi:prolyl-tRNA synthetase
MVECLMAKDQLPQQAQNFPGWYLDVVKRAGLAEHGPARGSQIIKPYGFALWEAIQKALDDRFKSTGHENVYFPLLFPESLLAQEAEHVEGFAPQVAVVTRGGGEELEEPLAIRPTSEAIIWSTYRSWVQSYRDLPLLLNQWCNVVRWEMRTRLLLRTSEFLWQEGHTAHSTSEEALEEALRMLEVYREVAEDELAIPVLTGRKSASERFPGAVETFPIEALMRDGKALQAGTSHFLGQNFAKAYDVQFLTAQGEREYAWATSWGVSTRVLGGVVMAHGDDRGLRLPPRVAPTQIVIVPIYSTDEDKAGVLELTNRVSEALKARSVRVKVDDRDQYRPGFKFAEWELKGVPLRVEIGPRDVAADQVTVANRVTGEKTSSSVTVFIDGASAQLEDLQRALFEDARTFRDENMREAQSFAELRDGLAEHGGFWTGPWCGDVECEEKVSAEAKATIRVLPLNQEDPGGSCVVCGKPGTERATWAQSY